MSTRGAMIVLGCTIAALALIVRAWRPEATPDLLGAADTGDRRHVAAAWNGGALSLYVDGAQMFLNSGPAAPNLAGDTTLSVGSAPANAGPGAPGQLSDLTVFNHDLSIDEVRQLFQSGVAPSQ